MKRKPAQRRRRSSSNKNSRLAIILVLLLAGAIAYKSFQDAHVLGVSTLLAQIPPEGETAPAQQSPQEQQSQPAPQQQSQPQPQQNTQQIQQSSQQQYQPKTAEEQQQMQQYMQQNSGQQSSRPYINPGSNDSGQYRPSQMGEAERRQEDAATRLYYEQRYQQTGSNANSSNERNQITPEQKQQMIQQMQQAEQQFKQEAAKNGIQFNGSLPPEVLIMQQQMMQKIQQGQEQNAGNGNSSNESFTQPINFSSFQALPSSKDFPTISGIFNVQIAGSQSRIDLNNVNTNIQLGGQNFGLRAKAEDGTEVEIDKSALEKINTAMLLETGAQIQQNQDGITLRRGQIEAKTKFPISFNVATKTFTVQIGNGTSEISVLPDQAVQKLLENKIISKVEVRNNSTTINDSSVILTEYNSKPVFEVRGASDQKMFGFFPISVSKTSIVSAESGNVVRTNQNIFSRFVDTISF